MSLYLLNKQWVFCTQNRSLLDTESGEHSLLGANEAALLCMFIDRQSQQLTSNDILDYVWQGKRAKSSVATAIKNLRRVLRDSTSQPKYIRTVVNKGYQFVAQVNFMSDSEFSTYQNRLMSPRHRLFRWTKSNKKALQLYALNAIAVLATAFFSYKLVSLGAYERYFTKSVVTQVIPMTVVGESANPQFSEKVCEALVTDRRQKATLHSIPLAKQPRPANHYPYLSWADEDKRSLICYLSPIDG